MSTTPAAKPKSGRRRARELALQGLYQWQLAKGAPEQIIKELLQPSNRPRADDEFFKVLLSGTIDRVDVLSQTLQPHLDRPFAELTPIERAVLLIGAFEMMERVDVPAAVVINEGVELAKTFGGTDGHKYVNGVLDKLAAQLRAAEAPRKRLPRQEI